MSFHTQTASHGDQVMKVANLMKSVPGADRGPRAGSPRGVVVATGSVRSVPGAVATGCNVHMIEDRDQETRSLSLPVLTSPPSGVDPGPGADLITFATFIT